MNGDFYYRSRCILALFLSFFNERSRSAFTASARLLQKHSSDRIVICVNYISRFACFSRYCLPTLHYELSSILGKFRLHGRVLDLVYENLATSRYKAKPTNAYRAVGSTNRFPSLIRPLANYTVLDQCKSCVSWFLFFFVLRRDKKEEENRTAKRFVSKLLRYMQEIERSRIGTRVWVKVVESMCRMSNHGPYCLFAVSIDRSTFPPLETVEFQKNYSRIS